MNASRASTVFSGRYRSHSWLFVEHAHRHLRTRGSADPAGEPVVAEGSEPADELEGRAWTAEPVPVEAACALGQNGPSQGAIPRQPGEHLGVHPRRTSHEGQGRPRRGLDGVDGQDGGWRRVEPRQGVADRSPGGVPEHWGTRRQRPLGDERIHRPRRQGRAGPEVPRRSPEAVVGKEKRRDDPPPAPGGLLEDEPIVQGMPGVAVQEEHVTPLLQRRPRGRLHDRDGHGLASNSLLDLSRDRTHL